MKYADKTSVSVEKSKGEIEATLIRYGASQFISGWTNNEAKIGFEMHGRRIMFTLPLPSLNDREFTHTPGRNYRRDSADQQKAWEQACRQRWRALALAIKAKLEAVETGITTFEHEFLSHFVVPGTKGQTVGDIMIPQLDVAYKEGRPLPPLLGHHG